MKKNLKKMMAALLTLAMMIVICPDVAYAETSASADNNDIPGNATLISSKEAITGVLSSDEDVDYYKYTVDVTGYYNFTYTNVNALGGDWHVSIYNSQLKELEGVRLEGDYTKTSNTYNFSKGTVLYLKVQNDYREAVGQEYSIKVNAAADANWEQESSDTKDTATIIDSKTVKYGNLYSDEDVDYYKYTVDVTGKYYFTYTNVNALGGDWHVSVYDSALKELDGVRLEGDYTKTSSTFDFKKGTVLYLKVQNDYHEAIGQEYSIAVNASSDSKWEQEANDTKGAATVINSKTTKHGNLYSDEDVDYYKYKVDVSGYYSFTFTDINSRSGDWNFTVYDSTLKELESGRVNDAYTYTSRTYNFSKGTILYVKISNGYNEAVGKEYSLAVNAKNSSSWEQEKNDTINKPVSLKLNAAKYGTLYTNDDVDYYSYTATKTGTIKTAFTFDADEIGDGWEIVIYDSSKKVIKTVPDIVTNKSISFKATKGKKYYIAVQADDDYYAPVNIKYTLKLK